KDEEARSVTKQIFSTSGGLSQLTHALANHIGREHFSCSAEGCRITRTAEGLYELLFTTDGTTRTLRAHHVITTAPAPALP
ncbi:FAD-dependent oxidoreductase, partial [Porphyromonas sp.]